MAYRSRNSTKAALQTRGRFRLALAALMCGYAMTLVFAQQPTSTPPDAAANAQRPRPLPRRLALSSASRSTTNLMCSSHKKPTLHPPCFRNNRRKARSRASTSCGIP
jgi:hypothetical protein